MFGPENHITVSLANGCSFLLELLGMGLEAKVHLAIIGFNFKTRLRWTGGKDKHLRASLSTRKRYKILKTTKKICLQYLFTPFNTNLHNF